MWCESGWDTAPASAEGEGAGWANFDNQATQLPPGDGQAAVGQEAPGWASFEAPSAADTSGNSSVEGGNLSGGAANWADFSALDAAGGEGFGSTSLTDENKEKSGKICFALQRILKFFKRWFLVQLGTMLKT